MLLLFVNGSLGLQAAVWFTFPFQKHYFQSPAFCISGSKNCARV